MSDEQLLATHYSSLITHHFAMQHEPQSKVFRWALRYLRPYRLQIILLFVVSGVEIASGLLLPWPLKIIVDHVLGSEPMPRWLVAVVGADSHHNLTILLIGCLAYLIFNLV